MAIQNEIVREMERFLDRLLDPSMTFAEKSLYLQARGAGMRERIRFLSLPDPEQVRECERGYQDLFIQLGGVILDRSGPDGLFVPDYRMKAVDPNRHAIYFTPKFVPGLYVGSWGAVLKLGPRTK